MEEISYNFGAIRDSIMRLSASEILKESKNNTIHSFINLIKKIPILQKQHLIYKNLQESKSFEKDRLAERFLNQNLQLFSNEKWENILRENKILRKTLLNDFHVEAKKNGELFENINTLIKSKTMSGFIDFEKEQNAYEYIISYLTRPTIVESEKSKEINDSPKLIADAWKFITKMAVNNFNERFAHLNESEKKAFKILISDNNTKKNYFNSLKNENLELINKQIENIKDNKTLDLLHTFKKKIENIGDENLVNLDEGIISCLELKESLNSNL